MMHGAYNVKYKFSLQKHVKWEEIRRVFDSVNVIIK